MTYRHLFTCLGITILLIAIGIMVACKKTEMVEGFKPEILPLPKQLASYEPIPEPPDNPTTQEKVALGRQLFFDERLSVDGSRSCYSCHVCEKGLTDGLPKAIGAG